jgi:hypothetical protein
MAHKKSQKSHTKRPKSDPPLGNDQSFPDRAPSAGMGRLPTTHIYATFFLTLRKHKPPKQMAKMIKEYGGKEKYASKAAMMKHEKKEGKKVEKMEKKGVFPKMKKK